MRHMSLTLSLILAAGSVLADDARPRLRALPEAKQRLVATWLIQDCGIGDPLAAQMAQGRGVIEPSLWEAYELGPSEAERQALQASLDQSWADLREWLARDGARVLGEEMASRLTSMSEDEFRSTEARKHEDRYRDAALAGLGLACTGQSRSRMEAIANNERNPSRQAARQALRRSGGCSLVTRN